MVMFVYVRVSETHRSLQRGFSSGRRKRPTKSPTFLSAVLTLQRHSVSHKGLQSKMLKFDHTTDQTGPFSTFLCKTPSFNIIITSKSFSSTSLNQSFDVFFLWLQQHTVVVRSQSSLIIFELFFFYTVIRHSFQGASDFILQILELLTTTNYTRRR